MENGAIPDEDIWASSVKNSKSAANQGRLHFNKTWTADMNDQSPWLSVRLSKTEPYTITGVATQGKNGENAWVKSYKLRYQTSAGHSIRNYIGQVGGESFFGSRTKVSWITVLVYRQYCEILAVRLVGLKNELQPFFVILTQQSKL